LLNRLMSVSRVTDPRGVDLPYVQDVVVFDDDSIRQVDAVHVSLGRPVPPQDSVTLVIRYHGFLVGYTETGSLYIRDHVDHDFTIIREDAYAFPVLGQPSWTANRSIPREPFAFQARITVPSDLVVAMGGTPEAPARRDSLVDWTYAGGEPVPFLNITIAPYRVLENGDTRIFYFPADSDGARTVARAVTQALARYTGWFGPLGHDARLVIMEIPEGYGSQASLSAGIMQTADVFRDRTQLRQLYHELSHLWNVPDRDRPSPRWNEGLATFLERRMAADLDGWADWGTELTRTTESLMHRCRELGGCDTIPMAVYGAAGLTDRSYSTGMLMFYALYQVLGPTAFDRAYRGFFQRYRLTGGRTADLAAAFDSVDSRSERIFADWMFSARWFTRLGGGETMGRIVDGYRRP
jgi:hypothetical protein